MPPINIPVPREEPQESRKDHSKETGKDQASRKSIRTSQKGGHLSHLVPQPARKSEFLKAVLKSSHSNLPGLERQKGDDEVRHKTVSQSDSRMLIGLIRMKMRKKD